MTNLFTEENYYWCMYCGNYSMELVSIDERDYSEHRIYECVLCCEKDDETVYLD